MSNGRLGSGGYRGRLRALPRVAVGRIRPKAWAIVQTATAAGLAWYVAHILLGHPRPFFAPIAAAVCLSDSNLLRGQRALQMIGGVTLGIGTGIGVHAILGPGAAAIGLVVLVVLLIAVVVAQGFIAQGLMFFNQSAASAVLVIALPGSGSERLFDALIGGALALLFSIVIFPAAPLPLLAQATRTTCTTLSNILDHLDQLVSHSETPATEWTLDAAEHINQSLDSLTKGALYRQGDRPLRSAAAFATTGRGRSRPPGWPAQPAGRGGAQPGPCDQRRPERQTAASCRGWRRHPRSVYRRWPVGQPG